jgi:N-acylneuraminate cytidylyltransferase
MPLIVLPAKFESTRLPQKNFKPFLNGLSLLQICALRSLNSELGPVVISTDRPDVAEKQIDMLGVDNIEIILRPDHLSRDPATVLDVLNHASIDLPASDEAVISVLPTSPFNSSDHIRNAWVLYQKANADKVISVSRSSAPPYNAWLLDNDVLTPAFPDSEFKLMQSTRCPRTYHSNGCVGIYDKSELHAAREFKRSIGYEMPMCCSLDIDYSFEFEMARNSMLTLIDDASLLEPYYR